MTVAALDAERAERARSLIGAYVDAVDRGQATRIASLFAADGVLEIQGESFDAGRYEGREAILARFEASSTAFATLGTTTRVRHHVSSIRLSALEDGAVRADCYFLAVTDRGPDHWGRYADRLVQTGGGWRFARRAVVHEGRLPGSFTEELTS